MDLIKNQYILACLNFNNCTTKNVKDAKLMRFIENFDQNVRPIP